MRKILYLLTGVMALAACSREPLTVCFTTYNVGAFGKYTDNSTAMVAAMMHELGAGAIGVNEIDSVTFRKEGHDQLREFAEALGEGWDYNFSRAMPYSGGAYGIGTLVSPEFKAISKHTVALPRCDGSEPRALSVIETEEFVVAATHLDHMSDSAQLVQAATITSWMKERYGDSSKPVVLMGDFNATPDSETLALMREDWNIVSPEEFSFPSRGADICIDYIMLLCNGAEYEVLDSHVVTALESGSVADASDHLPVYARITLK